jgi:8-oxo-dGTP pyrophosphatase MutT (NUDIX family)
VVVNAVANMIDCQSIYGNRKLIPREKLVFRPAAYAIIVNDGRILLITNHSSGKLFPPGGGVELGERIEDALKREVKEETGIEIEIEQFCFFREGFFYYDPSDTAYHTLSFFFTCTPKTLDLIDDDQIEDDEAETPRWIDPSSLSAEDFQICGEKILRLLYL